MTESMNKAMNEPEAANSIDVTEDPSCNNISINPDSKISNKDSSKQTNEKQEESVDIEEQKRYTHQALLQALQAQLEYYFSPTNLYRDAFLCSVMTSNKTNASPPSSDKSKNDDGHVDDKIDSDNGKYAPITLLARFGNIQKIIHLYESQRQQFLYSANVDQDVIEQESYYQIVPDLLRDSALLSSSLRVVFLEGDISEDSSKNTSSKLDQVPASSTIASASSDILTLDVLRLGIGPTQLIWDETEKMKSTNDNQGEKSVEKNIIILRDMPTSATEEEIREIFTWEDCPKVKSVHSEVGNFWFVSLDATYDQIVEALLELRNKKFKGEHDIKARLKTESLSKPLFSSNYYPNTSQNNGYSSGLNKNHYNNNSYNGVGNGRPQYYRRSNKLGSSDQYTYRNRYQQTAPYVNGPKRYSSTNNSMRVRGYRSGSSAGGPYTKAMEDKTQKAAAVPPPPLEMEAHFPALGGTPSATSPDSSEESSGANTPEDGESKSNSKNPDEEGDSAKKSNNEPSVEKNAPKEIKKATSGYAAALLKAAPKTPTTTTSTQVKTQTRRSSTSTTTSQQKKGSHHDANRNLHNTKDAKSAGGSTATTDPADRFSDSSTSSNSAATDDKSRSLHVATTITTTASTHLTEKASNEKGIVGGATTGWGNRGGKKSFADILKIK